MPEPTVYKHTRLMRVESDLKKYKALDGYYAKSYTRSSLIKHLSLKFKISEFELHKAVNSNKIRIYVQ